MGKVSESAEQSEVVLRLRRAGYLVAAVPNGGDRTRRGAGVLKREGVSPGVPDLLIFDPPDDLALAAELNAYESDLVALVGDLSPERRAAVLRACGATPGVGLEMKVAGAGGVVSGVQEQWLGDLRQRGWIGIVGRGWRDAIQKLRQAGYTRL